MWNGYLNNEFQIQIVFFNFCKPMLRYKKIHSNGLGAIYLEDRRQKVKIGYTVSGDLNIETGIPQGSILGQFLFIM